eukprot:gene4837-5906_t
MLAAGGLGGMGAMGGMPGAAMTSSGGGHIDQGSMPWSNALGTGDTFGMRQLDGDARMERPRASMSSSQPSGEGILSLLIPDGVEKRLIGKGGSAIKELITQTRADIQIPRNLVRGDGNRVVQIRGDLPTRISAASLIAERVEDSLPVDPRKGRLLHRFVVTREMGPKLVGKQGANIREIQAATGADVQVRADELDNSQTIVNICGPSPSCNEALQTLIERVDREQAQ